MIFKSIEIEPSSLLSNIKGHGKFYTNLDIKENKLLSAILEAERYNVEDTDPSSLLRTLRYLSRDKKYLGYQDTNKYKVDKLISVLKDYNIDFRLIEFTL